MFCSCYSVCIVSVCQNILYSLFLDMTVTKSNCDFNMLTKTPHHHAGKGTSHDLEDSQFSTKATFRYNLSVKEEKRQRCKLVSTAKGKWQHMGPQVRCVYGKWSACFWKYNLSYMVLFKDDWKRALWSVSCVIVLTFSQTGIGSFNSRPVEFSLNEACWHFVKTICWPFTTTVPNYCRIALAHLVENNVPHLCIEPTQIVCQIKIKLIHKSSLCFQNKVFPKTKWSQSTLPQTEVKTKHVPAFPKVGTTSGCPGAAGCRS